eukprot:TRINITY_DN3440_c0_g2_i3.p1 TRINITY_DN3440_c0_g2~~TRINITY_DN3440_c0_g2_i3.p1  ORF type:complete len:317 (+),score=93.25 TRINITY_DN3440_c0_g2_i3:29-979(+)
MGTIRFKGSVNQMEPLGSRQKKRERKDNEEMEEEEPGLDFSKKFAGEGEEMEEEKFDPEEDIFNAEFEFYDPDASQFHSVKNLINGLLDGLSFRSSQLADIVVNQSVVGTMVGVADDEDNAGRPNKDKNVFAFATILNLTLYRDKDVIKEIKKFILDKNKAHNDEDESFITAVDAPRVGFFINERILNVPPQLVPILHKQLLEDLKWVREQDEEDSRAFTFDYIIGISKCHKDAGSKSKKKSTGAFDDYLFPKFEDHELLKASEAHFLFQAHSTRNLSGLTNLEGEMSDQICYRLVYVITYDKFVEVLSNLEGLIG